MTTLKQIEEKFDEKILYPYGVEYGRYNGMSLDEERKLKQFITSQITELLEILKSEMLIREEKTDLEVGFNNGWNNREAIIRDKINKILSK